MDPFCHLTELSLPVLLRIIAHLDDASATQLAIGGSCARDAVIAHANIAYASALHRLEARTSNGLARHTIRGHELRVGLRQRKVFYLISCDHCVGPADAA